MTRLGSSGPERTLAGHSGMHCGRLRLARAASDRASEQSALRQLCGASGAEFRSTSDARSPRMTAVCLAPTLTIRKRKHRATATDVLAAVSAVLDLEFKAQGADRLRALLDVELGRRGCLSTLAPLSAALVTDGGGSVRPRTAAPLTLPVTRPKLTAAVLEAFGSSEPLHDGSAVGLAPAACIGATRLEKLMVKRVVEWLRERKGDELFQPGGELSDAKLTDKARLTRTVERAVLDALAYVHAKAAAIRGEGDEGAVLQLQSADETLGGKQLRGSGLVYCERGRSLFQRALADCSLSLQPTLSADRSAEGAAQ